MHELGVLVNIVRTVCRVAEENSIDKIRHITLEVGEASGIVPAFMNKLFPVAIEHFPVVADAVLKLEMVSGQSLIIKEIGY